jgi:uncharacterized RDD family membrane protein YckC
MLLHEVVTTEKVLLRYRVAGLGSRFLAWLVDAAIIGFLVVPGAFVMAVLEVARGGVGMAVFMLWLFLLQWGYFLLFEWRWRGQTPGKRLLGVRVIRLDGTSVSFFEAALRNLMRPADSLPWLALVGVYGVGFVRAARNREERRLGDLAAGTLVVHVQTRGQPIRALHETVRGDDRARRNLLRQRLEQLTREQQQTLLDVCLRRDQLQVQERTRLFGTITEHVKERLGLAPEEYQSDEKFVLELADVLNT